MSHNDFWSGSRQAILHPGTIRTEWGSGDHSGATLSFCNQAFRIFFLARRNQVLRGGTEYSEQIRQALEDCATTGWGTGIHDLQDAFRHLTETGGFWTDDASTAYYGGPKQVSNKSVVTAPVSIVNFMNAVDQNGAVILERSLQDFLRLIQKLADVVRGIPRESKAVRDYEKSVELIRKFKSDLELAKPWLWTVQGTDVRVGVVFSITDVLAKLQSAVGNYSLYSMFGLNQSESAIIASVIEAIGCIPVLGGFYQKAAEMIPGIADSFATAVTSYHSRIKLALSAR